MAVRGATKCIARATNPSLLSISRSLYSPSRPLPPHTLISLPLRSGLKFPIRVIQEASAEAVAPKKRDGEEPAPNWKIKMLYDGDCPLCMREVNMLQERNKKYGTIKFVNICSDDYSPDEHQGLDYETAMGRIHAIQSDGTIVKDVEAFRKLYEQVDLGWVYAITKYEPVASLADAVYGVWAKYRLPITGRQPLEEILEARRKKKADGCNDSNTCKR